MLESIVAAALVVAIAWLAIKLPEWRRPASAEELQAMRRVLQDLKAAGGWVEDESDLMLQPGAALAERRLFATRGSAWNSGYSLTAAGERELAAWAQEVPPTAPQGQTFAPLAPTRGPRSSGAG